MIHTTSQTEQDLTKIRISDEDRTGKQQTFEVILDSRVRVERKRERMVSSASRRAFRSFASLLLLMTCNPHLQPVRADPPSSSASVWDRWWAYDGISGESVHADPSHAISLIQAACLHSCRPVDHRVLSPGDRPLLSHARAGEQCCTRVPSLPIKLMLRRSLPTGKQ